MQSFYDSIAKKWDATRQRPWGEFEFAKDFLSAEKILDAGCGNGRLVTWLRENNFNGEYLGVDSSQELIKLARRNFPGEKFEATDLLELIPQLSGELTLGGFGAIFCIAVLHHFENSADRAKVLENLHEVLEPGGKIFLTTWNLWQPRFWKFFLAHPRLRGGRLSRNLEIPFAGKSSRRVHAFTKSELFKLLATAGFKNIKIFYAKHSAKANFLTGRNIVIIAEK